ncbi:MAG: MarR family transcriptional regulator [Planctomycetota bacterium]|nr:MarR family transcriptional regulator [Planctomycetota bacterium]
MSMTKPPKCTEEIAELLVHIGRSARGEDTDSDLTATQWTALRFFARANRVSRTPSAFASFQATTRGTASKTLKSLETKGLLARRRSERDGRSVLFEVTDRARVLLERDPLRHLITAIDRSEASSRTGLVRALSTLAAELANLRGAPAFGTCNDCAHYTAGNDGGGYCACVAVDLAPDEVGKLCVSFEHAGNAALDEGSQIERR